jgi:hypothetical protein
MKNQGLVAVLSLLIFSLGCSKDSSTASSTSSNAMLSTYSNIVSQVSEVSGLLDTNLHSNVLLHEIISANFLMAPAAPPLLQDDWSVTLNMGDDTTSSGSDFISLKDWMGHQLDPAVLNYDGGAMNVFGRLNQALAIFCALGVGSEAAGQTIDENGYLGTGTFSLTFTSSVKTKMNTTCGVDVSGVPDNASMTVTSTAVSGDYDRQYTFSLFQQTYLVKNSGGIVNIASGENQQSGAVSRTIVNWNQNTGKTLVEYVSNPGTATAGTTGLYAYRMYYDETNDDGQILTYEGSDDGIYATRYILAGKPQTGDAFSLSIKTTQIATSALLEACVSSTTGDIVASGDGARCSASSTRTVGADVSSLDTLFTNFLGQKTQTAWGTVSSTTALAWSSKANMLTTPISHDGN